MVNWTQANQLIESIAGFMEPRETKALYDLAGSLPNGSTILEIGAFKGKSTACLALACLGTDKRIWSIDPFTNSQITSPYSLDIWSDNMRQIGVRDIVNPVVGLSSEIAPTWNKQLDLLFIDGAHAYEGVLADVQNYFPWLRIGCTIAMHDVAPPPSPWDGVWRVWTENVVPYCDSLCFYGSLAVGRKCK